MQIFWPYFLITNTVDVPGKSKISSKAGVRTTMDSMGIILCRLSLTNSFPDPVQLKFLPNTFIFPAASPSPLSLPVPVKVMFSPMILPKLHMSYLFCLGSLIQEEEKISKWYMTLVGGLLLTILCHKDNSTRSLYNCEKVVRTEVIHAKYNNPKVPLESQYLVFTITLKSS